MKSDKIIMLVGGTDCSGGAGLAADISVVRMLQCYPMPVVSCITSQGPDGFRMMQPASIDIFTDQLKSVLSNVRPDAVKIGMLPSSKHMEILTLMLARYDHGPVIFDPIMAPTEGAGNFDADWWKDESALAAFLSQIDMITPNLPELRRLAEPLRNMQEIPIPEEIPQSNSEMMRYMLDMHLVRAMYDLDCVLLTGGHNAENPCTDILMYAIDDEDQEDDGTTPDDDDDDNNEFDTDGSDNEAYPDTDDEENEGVIHYDIGIIGGQRIDTVNTHGTGCVYSTAIATLLGQDLKVYIAVSLAKKLMMMFLESGKNWRLFESGHGPAFSVLRVSADPDRKSPLLTDFGLNGMMN